MKKNVQIVENRMQYIRLEFYYSLIPIDYNKCWLFDFVRRSVLQ